MKLGNIVRVETSRYFTKITALQRKANREGSCSQAIWLCYNYYVRLVVTKRGRMRVANLKFCTATATAMCTTSFTPPFGERSKISNSVRGSNFAWLPPAVYSNCSEWTQGLFWLPWRIILVG